MSAFCPAQSTMGVRMSQQTRRSSIVDGNASSPPQGCTRWSPARGRDRRLGQAYTEYLVILLFGVFFGLGLVVIDKVIPPEQVKIMDRLYGYIFDYYAGLANFLNLPMF